MKIEHTCMYIYKAAVLACGKSLISLHDTYPLNVVDNQLKK